MAYRVLPSKNNVLCVFVISCNVFCHAFLSWLQCEWLVAVVDDEHAHNTTQHTVHHHCCQKVTLHSQCLPFNQSINQWWWWCALCHPIPFSLSSLSLLNALHLIMFLCVLCDVLCTIIVDHCTSLLCHHLFSHNQINQCVQCNTITNKKNNGTVLVVVVVGICDDHPSHHAYLGACASQSQHLHHIPSTNKQTNMMLLL